MSHHSCILRVSDELFELLHCLHHFCQAHLWTHLLLTELLNLGVNNLHEAVSIVCKLIKSRQLAVPFRCNSCQLTVYVLDVFWAYSNSSWWVNSSLAGVCCCAACFWWAVKCVTRSLSSALWSLKLLLRLLLLFFLNRQLSLAADFNFIVIIYLDSLVYYLNRHWAWVVSWFRW